MEVSSSLVAGSHDRNEIIIIRSIGESSIKPLEQSSGKLCKICGDDVGLSAEREVFVACNECAFPICRTCYEYERREGNQVCPQCKTRFKRIKGCARVEGDEEEDDVDDLDNEFDFDEQSTHNMHRSLSADSDNSLLTNRRVADEIGSKEFASFPPLAVPPRPMDPSKDPAVYGYGSIAWKDRMERWKKRQNKLQMMNNERLKNLDHDEDDPDMPLSDEGRQPLSRKLSIPSSQINPYRMIIVIRLVVMAFFFHYRVTHPVHDAYLLWLISVICESWFAISWILDQLPKWVPIARETYPCRLSLRYEKEGQPCQLSAIDVFVSTDDPSTEHPLITANTILSILAVDYPADKVSCYVSDDCADILTFEALSETAEFARKWIPFCKKYKIEPRAPERYYDQKVDYFSDKVLPSFVKERRAMKRDYDEFKVRINSLVAKSKKIPDEGWTMQDGTPWPGNNGQDHPGMIQIFLGPNGGFDVDGNELPCMVYISREKRPGFNHNKKVGAMNCLVRVSAILTNAPYVLNLDCDYYINNSKALREAMCFMMDPLVGKRVCYVQFPPNNRNTVFSDINMKCLDGIQGPIYVGTGCVFRRQALYGYDAPKPKKSPMKTCDCWLKWYCFSAKTHKRKNTEPKAEGTKNISRNEDFEELLACSSETTQESIDSKLAKKFGLSPMFVASTLGELNRTSPGSSLKEAMHVISCGYEDKTEWGNEVGWIYGSATSDMLTGLKMHCHGWRSVYCAPERPAFKGTASTNLLDRLDQVLRSALGSIEILFSKHCPVWYGYGGGLKPLERLSYINTTVHPWTSIPLVAYCTLPAICLLTGKFIVPELGTVASMWFISLFMCIFATSLLEMKWSGVGIGEWWRNVQFGMIDGASAHLFAICQGLLKVLAGIETSKTEEISKFDALKWRILLIPPTTLLVLNLIGVVFGVSSAINKGFESWGQLLGKIFFAFWVIVHLYPLLKGVLGGQNRAPTIILVWSVLLASLFSIFWVRIESFSSKSDAPYLEECGVDCV